MSYLGPLLLGLKRVMSNGVMQTFESSLNFIGATVADNPTLGSTDVTIPAATPGQGSLAGIGAWSNAFDWVCSAAPTVAGFGVDGSYTANNATTSSGTPFTLSMVSLSNANAAVANALTNGVGIRLNPLAASVFTFSNSNNAPGVFIPFTGIISLMPSVDWRTRFRLYVSVAGTDGGTNTGNAVIASLETDRTAATGVGAGASGPSISEKFSLKRGKKAGVQCFWCENRVNIGAQTSAYKDGSAITFDTSNNLMILEAGFLDPITYGFYGPSAGSIPPAPSTMIPVSPAQLATISDWHVNTDSATLADAYQSDLSHWGVSVRAEGNSGATFQTTISRIRLDYRLA